MQTDQNETPTTEVAAPSSDFLEPNAPSESKYLALGEEPVGSLLVKYALPAIVAMVASSLYNIVDGIFVGQSMGASAISALALCNPLMAITAAVGAMVGMGGATLMSVKLGQRDYDSARTILGNVVLLNIVFGLGLGAVLHLLMVPTLRLFGASPDTLPYASEYMSIILIGNVFTHLYYGLNAQLRSANRPNLAMYSTFGAVAINALLDWIFIFHFNWGVAGAAWATVIAQIIMLAWQFSVFLRKGDVVHLLVEKLRPRPRLILEILAIGLPQLLMNTCAAAVGIVIVRSMAHYGGDTAIGAYGIVNRLVMFMAFVVFGLTQGMQPIAGYNYGAQRTDRLVQVVKLTILAATTVTTLSFLLFTLFPELFVGIFVKNSPSLAAEAAQGLRVVVIVFPFVGMQIVSSAFFQSIGKPAKSIFLSLTRQMIFLIPLLLLLPALFTRPLEGLWWAMPISDAAASIVSAVLLVQEYRKYKHQLPL